MNLTKVVVSLEPQREHDLVVLTVDKSELQSVGVTKRRSSVIV